MYKVTLKDNYPYEQRVRAGITVSRDGGYVGELTDAQLAAVEADQELIVSQVSAPKPEGQQSLKAVPKKA